MYYCYCDGAVGVDDGETVFSGVHAFSIWLFYSETRLEHAIRSIVNVALALRGQTRQGKELVRKPFPILLVDME